LILDVMDYWVRDRNAQWVFLGTGQPEIEKKIRELAAAYPNRVAAQITFSNELAHQIEAGSDIFLMPSRYEPCGLNQMYSLKYGTVPVVHATGGLRDTITNTTEESLSDGSQPNGFVFYDFRPDALHGTLDWATNLYSNRPETWKQLVTRGMTQDWSWRRSAQEYVSLYQATIVRAKEIVCA
ncbi:MAG: glycosyltransferase, partial [Planctomycetota bacterium]